MKYHTHPNPERWSVLIYLFAAITFAFCSSSARPDTTTWTGEGDGSNWFDGGNWDNGVPDSAKDAVINNGAKVAINQSGAFAQSLTIGAGAGDSGTLVVDGTNGGSLEVPGGCVNQGPGIFPGLVSVGYGGTGTLVIRNGATVSSGYAYVAALGSQTDSIGTVTVDGVGSTWTISTTCSAYARLWVGGSQYLNGVLGPDEDPGGTAILNVTNGGAITVNNHPNAISVKVGLSGTLTGNGTITNNANLSASRLTAVKGTLAPTGNLALVSDLGLSNTATTVCKVTPDAADNVQTKNGVALGQATLDGRLIVILKGTFTRGETCTTRFRLFHADGGRSGTFSQGVSIVGLPPNAPYTPQITYESNDVYLDLVFNNCD